MFFDLVNAVHGVVWNYYIRGQNLSQPDFLWLRTTYLPGKIMKKRHLGTQPHIFGIELSIYESSLFFMS